jgi:V/A-type H+-transporting ATPase subunit K
MFDSAIAVAIAGAALSVFLGGAGSAIGVGLAGLSGAGVISEKPELFGKVIVLQALPGTQGIYGFLGGFLVLFKLGLIGGEVATISMETGWQFFYACLPVAFTCLISGIYQGKVAAAGLHAVAKDPSNAGKAIILSAMVETYAVIGLLTTILIWVAIEV